MSVRDEFINGLRAMADMFAAHPEIPLPTWGIETTLYGYEIEEPEYRWENMTVAKAREIMALSPGGWDKKLEGGRLTYTKRFAGSSRVRYTLDLNREQVCKKVVTGVKHVEAKTIEAHDIEEFEWVCTEPDAIDS